ncbi:phosphate ABC transporter substrate-binding protein [Thiohalorhabdus denitrificans]|uniref:Phosphate transport system substrate-binding protein n=1 Tax=Thiohalorhabdus denitrificans TaxID=381306 RepID=A0A1G5FQB2_9GAMM|nr:phosphate ABC transporter substrate-binding protein [Thiohalorhabdus denitrificans]SCY41423.1 phosphate transport system substrate-binding protein [Thiohalorhabdus denitrificans]
MPGIIRLVALGVVVATTQIMASPASAATLQWGGCGITKKAFMSALAERFEAKTGTEIEIQGGGATFGVRGVKEGEIDLGGSCRPAVAGDEREDVQMVQVAWDALVAIVHPSNPVDEISSEELQQVFRGEITNWKELGGPDKFIIVGYRSPPLSGVGYAFRELGFRKTTGSGDFTQGLARQSSGPLETAVEKLPDAMAVTGVSSAKKREVKLLALDGVKPTPENIASAEYPLYRPLYLTVSKDPKPVVQRFVDFALSAEGQRIIADEGTVNLEMGEAIDNPWGGDYVEVAQ